MKLTENDFSKRVMKKLSEMAMDFDTPDRPDPDIQRKLKAGEMPLKKVPMPATGREPNQNFQELLASERYKQTVERVRRYAGLGPEQTIQGNIVSLTRSAIAAIDRIIDIEAPHIHELRRISNKISNKRNGNT